MNNEYNKQNNGGQNRQFNNTEKNVTRENTDLTCTCCEEPKKGIKDQVLDFATKNKTTLIVAGAVVGTAGLGVWLEKKFGWGKKLWGKIRGNKKAEEAPAAEAPAEEQK